MRIEELREDHLDRIRPQATQAHRPMEREAYLSGRAYAMVDGGVVFVCCGFTRMDQYRQLFWAVVSDEARTRLTRITKLAQRILALQSGEIWMAVERGFLPGERWARIYGFQPVPDPEGVCAEASFFRRYF